MKSLLLLVALSSACVPYYEPGPVGPTPYPTPTPTPVPAPSDALEVRGAIEYGGRFEVALPSGRVAAYPFTARAGAAVSIGVENAPHGTSIGLYGPVSGSGDLSRAPLMATGGGVVTLQSAGTYLAGFGGAAGAVLVATVGCNNGECRAECGAGQTCPSGATCALVQCIRAPCPSYCVPMSSVAPVPPIDEPTTPGGQVGARCGSRGLSQCAPGLFCEFSASAQCGAADQPGTCREVPQACTFEHNPVCGCDGRIYSNACGARAVGVSINPDRNACAPTTPPPPTGGQVGAACGVRGTPQCATGLFCEFPATARCGAADRPGACTQIPTRCTREHNPVCGCDGRVYANACVARAAGASVNPDASACNPTPPPPPVGGQRGDACGVRGTTACAAGLFCRFQPRAQCGAADRPGTCEDIPQVCTQESRPVCGCDGRTYGNRCLAWAAGTSVNPDRSACAPPPPPTGGAVGATCGGLAGARCATGLFCEFSAGARCGIADQTGTCQQVPQVCTREFRPVCGCDGRTYPNLCTARAAGVSVNPDRGACAPAPPPTTGGIGQTCGTRGAAQCATGLFCEFPASAQCGATDRGGTCQEMPRACTREFRPVCGCDGRTYPNLCTARATGVSVNPDRNACAAAPPTAGGVGATCGGIAGAQCGTGLFCEFRASARCGAGDQTGTCQEVPQVCTREYRPVCGCDGRTYPNLCTARAAGVSVNRDRSACAAPGPSTRACVVGGCSSQLCIEEGSGGISTCEWRSEYACYRSATCTRQANGQCGWSDTAELRACLANPPRQ